MTATREKAVIDGATRPHRAGAIAEEWVRAQVPEAWRHAAETGGPSGVRSVRSQSDYEAWYPVLGRSGLVVPAWEPVYGGLGVSAAAAREIDAVLRRYHLPRLNPLGLHNVASALFSFGTEEQRLRFLPPIVTAEERWCQLFSEPSAGSDLASLATQAVRDGDEWVVNGQKVWTTWAKDADFAILLARTDPTVPKRQGLTYFVVPMHQEGIEVRPLFQMTGEQEFYEVFLDHAVVPDRYRIGAGNDGWQVAASTLSSERQMVAGAGSGGIGRVGGSGAASLIELARAVGKWDDPLVRQRLCTLWSQERIRAWTNARVRAGLATGQAPGPEASIGKLDQGELNQRLQLAAVDLLGSNAIAWPNDGPGALNLSGPSVYDRSLPHHVRGMLRSRANTIEGGTSEVNRNILAERVLGLPREPDPWQSTPWREVPR